MSYQPAENPNGEEARVWCDGCGRAWFGPTAAHGLSVLGHCPRCGGGLRFRDQELPEEVLVEATGPALGAVAPMQPWQVLGTPNSWH